MAHLVLTSQILSGQRVKRNCAFSTQGHCVPNPVPWLPGQTATTLFPRISSSCQTNVLHKPRPYLLPNLKFAIFLFQPYLQNYYSPSVHPNPAPGWLLFGPPLPRCLPDAGPPLSLPQGYQPGYLSHQSPTSENYSLPLSNTNHPFQYLTPLIHAPPQPQNLYPITNTFVQIFQSSNISYQPTTFSSPAPFPCNPALRHSHWSIHVT